MAATNLIGTTNTAGSINDYVVSRWMNLPKRDFETPLTNSVLGATATIPNNQATSIVFRKFEDIAVATLVDQKTESAAELIKSAIIEVPLKEFERSVSLGQLLRQTDPVNYVKEAMDALMRSFRRGIHQEVQNALVIGIADTTLFEASGNFTVQPLKSIFAGEKLSYADLKEDDYFRMRDFERARSLLENEGAPAAMPNGDYAAVISHAIETQLIADDADFRDAVRFSDSQNNDIIKGARLTSYNRITFITQHDAYRSNLPDVSSGALATRVATGGVQVAHVLGKEAYAYVDLLSERGKRQRAVPNFKVQDITLTGVEQTIGARIPHRSAVIDRDYGLNLVGTTKFSNSLSQI